jgi:glycosyltransferase involved in cell wall biosynthesis
LPHLRPSKKERSSMSSADAPDPPGPAGRADGDRGPIVALVTDAVYPYSWGGRELRYREYARRLTGQARLHVFTMRWWPGPRTLHEAGVTFHAISPLIPMYKHHRRSIRQAMIFAIACVKLLGFRFDVLEADHMPYLHVLVLRLVATVRRKRFVVTWHEVWGSAYWRTYIGPLWFAAWTLEWLAMRLPDHIVAASAETADRLRAILGPGASITVAPNGIDLAGIRSVAPDPATTDVIVVGRLIGHKRVDMVLDAVARLRSEGLPVTCRVIGEGPDRAVLHQHAEQRGLAGAVDFRHDVHDQRELYALVKAARVFVSASEREGFGIAVLEALACGLPVVCSSSPDNLAQHLVARSSRGELVEPSVAALADTLKRLLAVPDEEPAAVVRPDEDAWLEEYSWETMTAQIVRALQLPVRPVRGQDCQDDSALNVAIFVHYLPPHVGGIEVVAENQAKSLAAAGEKVTVITSACAAEPGLSGSANYAVRRIRAWNYFEERWGAVFPVYAPSLIWHGYRAVRRADVVHVHDAFYLTSLVAAAWARVLRKPLILTQHIDIVPHPNPVVRLVQRLVYSTTGRFVLRSSRRIIVLNARVAEFLLGKGADGSVITFLSNGLDGAEFSPGNQDQKAELRRRYDLPAEKLLGLFVGRFVPKKGFETLLRLAPIPGFELVFAGGQAPDGHARADQHFLGVVDRASMPDIYRLCDIFVLPSEGEGFPVTAQEAMSCGLPVIITDDPAYEPYQLDPAFVRLVRPSARAIGAALRATVTDPGARQAMAAYSRQYALRNFELGSKVTELIAIYRSQAGTRGRAQRRSGSGRA